MILLHNNESEDCQGIANGVNICAHALPLKERIHIAKERLGVFIQSSQLKQWFYINTKIMFKSKRRGVAQYIQYLIALYVNEFATLNTASTLQKN